MSTNPDATTPHTDGHGEIGDRRHTHHDIPEHGHNPSKQTDVDENPDLTLHYSHEHQHNHLHHNRASLAGRHDDVLYADGTTFDKGNIGDVGPQDYRTHHLRPSQIDEKDFIQRDAEQGDTDPSRVDTSSSEDDGRKHRVSRAYARYRIFVHLFIWLLFTGYVCLVHPRRYVLI